METIILQGPQQNQDHSKDKDHDHSIVLVLDVRVVYYPFIPSLKPLQSSSLL